MTIIEYLDAIKEHLLADPIVADFSVTRERITLADGYLRARLVLSDDSRLEFSEYVQRSPDGETLVITYSYHWADRKEQLIRRWDNTPHYPSLPGFPHHIHIGDREVRPGKPVDIFAVLNEIIQLLTG